MTSVETEFGLLSTGRLTIMGLTPEACSFFRGNTTVLSAMAEPYGFPPGQELEADGYTFESDSDCEIILPLYYKYGLDMFNHLDTEFAMILYDSRKWLIAARDPIGIRPLFYGYSESATSPLLPGPEPDRPVKRSIRSPSAAITATASLCATAMLPIPPLQQPMIWTTTARSAKSWWPVWMWLNCFSIRLPAFRRPGSGGVCHCRQKLRASPSAPCHWHERDAIDLKYAKQVADYMPTAPRSSSTRKLLLNAGKKLSPYWAPGISPPSVLRWHVSGVQVHP